MNTLAIAAREIHERRLYFVAALLVGFMSLVVPHFHARPSDMPDLVHIALLSMALPLALVVSLGVGTSLFARPLADRRLSFYFSKPIGAWSIWSGKMLGGTALVLASVAIAVAPTLLQPGVASRVGDDLAAGGLPFLLAIAAIVAVSHFVAIALVSHTRWLALDFIVTPVVITLGLIAIGRVESVDAYLLSMYALVTFAVLLLVAFLAGSALGIVRGRTEAKRVHRETSIATASGVAIAALLAAGFAWWTTSGTLDLNAPHVWSAASSSGGNQVIVVQPAHGTKAARVALFDASTGRLSRIGASPYSSFAVSDDGAFAAWTERSNGIALPTTGRFRSELAIRTASGEVVRPGIYFDQPQPFSSPTLAFSPDNRLLAYAWQGNLVMLDTRSMKSVASFRLEPLRDTRMAFVTPSTLRVYASDRGTFVHIIEADAASHRLTERGTFAWSPMLRWNRQNDTIVVSTARDLTVSHAVDVLSAADGHVIRHIEPRGTMLSFWPGDTALFVAVSEQGRVRLEAFPLDGSAAHAVDVGAGDHASIGGEPRPGIVTVSIGSNVASWDASSFHPVLVDWNRGSARPLAIDGFPISRYSWTSAGVPPTGSVATRLFLGNGPPRLLDASSLELKRIRTGD